ncbi:MAG: hypothetical protein V4568_07800 [Pseudomonadota bacterium]
MQTTFLPFVDLEAVKHLEVHYLDPAILLPLAVSPERLKHLSHTEHFETNDLKDIHSAYEALSASEPVIDPAGRIDARWSVAFIGEKNQTLLNVSVDSFGGEGVINGNVVAFTYPAYIQWLVGRFAA